MCVSVNILFWFVVSNVVTPRSLWSSLGYWHLNQTHRWNITQHLGVQYCAKLLSSHSVFNILTGKWEIGAAIHDWWCSTHTHIYFTALRVWDFYHAKKNNNSINYDNIPNTTEGNPAQTITEPPTCFTDGCQHNRLSCTVALSGQKQTAT